MHPGHRCWSPEGPQMQAWGAFPARGWATSPPAAAVVRAAGPGALRPFP